MSDQITKHLTRLSMDLHKAAKERDAARAEADGLRALIEQNNRRCEIGCRRVQDWVNCGIAECGRCPRRYIIELPERAKG